MIVTGISHVGVQPTVQWHDQQVPMPMFGQSSQATTSSFWKDTNGATEGVITATAAAPGVALTPTTIPFTEAYTKRFGASPAYDGYSTYDDVNIIAHGREARRLHQPRQDGRGDGEDRLCRHDRAGGVLWPRQPVHACASRSVLASSPASTSSGRTASRSASGRRRCAQAKLVFPSFVKLPKQPARLIHQPCACLSPAERPGIMPGRSRAGSTLRRKPDVTFPANPDRRVRDQLALRPRRGGLHIDVRRLRRAQSRAWQHHGGGRDRRLARRRQPGAPGPLAAR